MLLAKISCIFMMFVALIYSMHSMRVIFINLGSSLYKYQLGTW